EPGLLTLPPSGSVCSAWKGWEYRGIEASVSRPKIISGTAAPRARARVSRRSLATSSSIRSGDCASMMPPASFACEVLCTSEYFRVKSASDVPRAGGRSGAAGLSRPPPGDPHHGVEAAVAVPGRLAGEPDLRAASGPAAHDQR